VLSGMKSLGGMAFSAAKARAGFAAQPTTALPSPLPSNPKNTRFFSHQNLAVMLIVFRRHHHGAVMASRIPSVYYVTIVDLAPTRKSGNPITIAEPLASRSQCISQLVFSADGSSLFVVPKEGQIIPVFGIRPTSMALQALESPPLPQLAPSSALLPHTPPSAEPPLHTYDLHRGHISAAIERVAVAHDRRWAAIGTANRTVHVFATNPCRKRGCFLVTEENRGLGRRQAISGTSRLSR
jgi:hypothetical protein